MTTGPSERARQVAEIETEGLIEQGADAVILTGSHARGDAHPESDLDLRVIGEGPSSLLKRSEEFLVSIAWLTEGEHRDALTDPGEVGEVVPGWRRALILHDPHGLASRIKAEAEAWEWGPMADDCDRWVADQITDYAEEVHTLIGNIDMDQRSGAAAIRSQLALHLAHFLSVHHRILYESENDLWDLVAEAMGEQWAELQSAALGIEGAGLEESCRASLELFSIAADTVDDLLDDRQREIVAHATKLAKRTSLKEGRSG
jgi:hypothetical protein